MCERADRCRASYSRAVLQHLRLRQRALVRSGTRCSTTRSPGPASQVPGEPDHAPGRPPPATPGWPAAAVGRHPGRAGRRQRPDVSAPASSGTPGGRPDPGRRRSARRRLVTRFHLTSPAPILAGRVRRTTAHVFRPLPGPASSAASRSPGRRSYSSVRQQTSRRSPARPDVQGDGVARGTVRVVGASRPPSRRPAAGRSDRAGGPAGARAAKDAARRQAGRRPRPPRPARRCRPSTPTRHLRAELRSDRGRPDIRHRPEVTGRRPHPPSHPGPVRTRPLSLIRSCHRRLWSCPPLRPQSPRPRTPAASGRPTAATSSPPASSSAPPGQSVGWNGRPVDLALSPDGRTLYAKDNRGLVVARRGDLDRPPGAALRQGPRRRVDARPGRQPRRHARLRHHRRADAGRGRGRRRRQARLAAG